MDTVTAWRPQPHPKGVIQDARTVLARCGVTRYAACGRESMRPAALASGGATPRVRDEGTCLFLAGALWSRGGRGEACRRTR
jgi:hypothetical protein